MVLVVPTEADVRWGRQPHAFFDYYRNSFSFSGDKNPCLFVRHAGGGVGASYQFYRSISATGRVPGFFRWLIEFDHPVRFDYCCFESGQYSYDNLVLPRCDEMIFPEAVVDCQRAIAEMKHMHDKFSLTHGGFDPDRCVGFGDSHGATLMGLAGVYPPLRGSGGDSTTQRGVYRGGTHDSTLRGMIYHIGQVDIRHGTDVAPVDDYLQYFNMAGWFGTRDDASGEFDNLSTQIKNASSLRAFVQNGDTRFYKPMYTLYQELGAHTYPLANSHDSQQRTDLNNALTAAGLPYQTRLYQSGDFDATYPFTGPVDPSSAVGQMYQSLYDFLVSCIS